MIPGSAGCIYHVYIMGHYDEVKNNPVDFSVLGMLSMFPITYSKYSDRKNHHLMSSSNNRISGNASTYIYEGCSKCFANRYTENTQSIGI